MGFRLTFTASAWRNENPSPAPISPSLHFCLRRSFFLYGACNCSQTANVQHITHIHIHKGGLVSHLFAIDQRLFARSSQMYRDLVFKQLRHAPESTGRRRGLTWLGAHLSIGDTALQELSCDEVLHSTFLVSPLSLSLPRLHPLNLFQAVGS